ncbi:hypothetical protein IKT18_00855 [Candidatus Saccharibacteria bacterium]|nr:hypothetical protein [Candidatus Saccharibacteria bacterium]
MAIIEMLSWWYAHGWSIFIKKLGETFSNLTDFFSISSLIRTLFQPYRQISALNSSSNSSLDYRFRAFIDRLISRLVGFCTRFFVLVFGLVAIIFSGVIGGLLIIAWPLVPFLPIAGIILTLNGFII